MYSLMIILAAASIWLGRNQTLYDFWFYITNFSRYPMEIYAGRSARRCGGPLRSHSGAGGGERAGPAAGLAAAPGDAAATGCCRPSPCWRRVASLAVVRGGYSSGPC